LAVRFSLLFSPESSPVYPAVRFVALQTRKKTFL
jgi:hypothetical protein